MLSADDTNEKDHKSERTEDRSIGCSKNGLL